MRITNKKRFITSLIVIGLVILFIIIFTKQTYSNVEIKNKIIYAASGDTLWSIACEEQESNKYYEGKKVNEIVLDIKYINELETSYIYAGQKIEIPTL